MRYNNLGEAVIGYMQNYNEKNEQALCEMYTNYINNIDEIHGLQARKKMILKRISKKENELTTQADKITSLTNEYTKNISILNAASKKYFEYENNFLSKILNYQYLKKLKNKIEKYTCRNRFLMIEIKTRDEYYKLDQQKLIELENMLAIIQSQLDVYENPYQNVEIENRNNDLLEYMQALNHGKIRF